MDSLQFYHSRPTQPKSTTHSTSHAASELQIKSVSMQPFKKLCIDGQVIDLALPKFQVPLPRHATLIDMGRDYRVGLPRNSNIYPNLSFTNEC